MFGDNPQRQQDMSDPYRLQVQGIFLTIQGEGPLSGLPAIFVRLAGCNLACHFCDTEFESGMSNIMTIPEILSRCQNLLENTSVKLCVITGGEPFRQPLRGLCNGLLLDLFNHVQIETAGTLWQDDMEALCCEGGPVSIVCSPKTPKVHPMILESCAHWKYIVRDGETRPSDGLPAMSTQSIGVPMLLFRPPAHRRQQDTIWVQAMDETQIPCRDADGRTKTIKNQEAAVDSALRFGYRVSFQMHKALDLP